MLGIMKEIGMNREQRICYFSLSGETIIIYYISPICTDKVPNTMETTKGTKTVGNH